jgi:hypothetical protein
MAAPRSTTLLCSTQPLQTGERAFVPSGWCGPRDLDRLSPGVSLRFRSSCTRAHRGFIATCEDAPRSRPPLCRLCALDWNRHGRQRAATVAKFLGLRSATTQQQHRVASDPKSWRSWRPWRHGGKIPAASGNRATIEMEPMVSRVPTGFADCSALARLSRFWCSVIAGALRKFRKFDVVGDRNLFPYGNQQDLARAEIHHSARVAGLHGLLHIPGALMLNEQTFTVSPVHVALIK